MRYPKFQKWNITFVLFKFSILHFSIFQNPICSSLQFVICLFSNFRISKVLTFKEIKSWYFKTVGTLSFWHFQNVTVVAQKDRDSQTSYFQTWLGTFCLIVLSIPVSPKINNICFGSRNTSPNPKTMNIVHFRSFP